MSKLTLRYDNQSYEITQKYWGESPKWADEQRDGTTITTTDTTQQTRSEAISNALDSVEAGTDYDSDTETPVPKLCYDPDTDELYAEVEIQPLPS